MLPSISGNRVATIRRRSAPICPVEIHVPTTVGIRANRCIRPGYASTACRLVAPVDAGIRVASVTPLTVRWRIDVPVLFQRPADLRLAKFLLLRKILARIVRLSVLGYKLRRFHIVRFPIEIENLIVGTQKILGVPMAFQAPCHAVRLGQIHRRHMINGAVATETTNAAIHVRRVIVINVIDGAIDPHPLHRVTRFPARPHRLQFRIIFLHLCMAIHAGLGVRHIRLGRHFHKAVAIPAIHSQLRDVDVMRKGHRLDRFVTNLCVLWRRIIPSRCGQSTDRNDAADHQFERYPVGPAWKEVGHGMSGKCGSAGHHQPP